MKTAIPIEIKDAEVLKALLGWLYHHKLVALMFWLCSWCKNVTITEGYREARHKGDVHATKPGRGIDIRSWQIKNPVSVAAQINQCWIYDPNRPEMKCCVYGDEKHFDHMHLQVCARTEFVGEK